MTVHTTGGEGKAEDAQEQVARGKRDENQIFIRASHYKRGARMPRCTFGPVSFGRFWGCGPRTRVVGNDESWWAFNVYQMPSGQRIKGHDF